MQPTILIPKEELVDYNEVCVEGRTSDHLLSSSSSEIDDIYEDTSEVPRLGEQYQAKVPLLLSGCERVQLLRNEISFGVISKQKINSGVGLAIPITWVHCHHIKREQQAFLGTPIGDDTTVSMDSTEHSSENEMDVAGGYIPLRSSLVSWGDVEVRSFLLGLYIFGKDLGLVGKLVGTKSVGDVMSFYYGKFYKSDAHCRWSESRKSKGRKCIHGQRIFAGWRKQELLSRLLPSIPINAQENLQEALESFSYGRSSLQEFVFTLKDMVGIDLLVEAVAIGKGKQDLTGTGLDQARSNQVIPTGPEIPVGNGCSSLTYEAIIKILTGGCRLSKAKSSDLFREAVWPRLLARGWHSEQPKDLRLHGSKIPLVFLVPGIKKFTRGKLTRGIHYFDSVSDVLKKVASEPRLLELDSEGAKESYKFNDADLESDQNEPSAQPRHCYLSPKRRKISPEPGKFTVMDTGLSPGDVPIKVRLLQNIIANSVRSYRASSSASSISRDSDDSNSVDLVDSGVTPNHQLKSTSVISEYNECGNTTKCITGEGVQSDLADPSEQRLAVNGHDSKNHYPEVLNEKQLDADAKCHSGTEHSAPVPKKRKPARSKHALNDHPSYFSLAYQLRKVNAYRVYRILKRNSTSTSAKPSQGEIDEFSSHVNFSGTAAACKAELSQEMSALIDLNIPEYPPNFEANEAFLTDIAGCQDEVIPKEADASKGVTSVELPNNIARRQGTRTRVPTAKALEALGCGFVGKKRKGSGTTHRAEDVGL